MGSKWIKISVLYFIIGIGVGLHMSASLQLNWAAAHAHVNVVGWLSTGLIGVIYSVYPKAGNSGLGLATFWLYNIGLPILLVSMFIIQIEGMFETAHILTFAGGGALALGIILFIINVFMNVHDGEAVTRQ